MPQQRLEAFVIGIISWVVMGAIGGWVIGQSISGNSKNLVGDIILGIAGALLGGFLFSGLLGITDATSSFNFITIIVAFFVAALVVGVVRTLIARLKVA